ncbi:MAG: NAD(P)/FAD-dependent oxidoreductase [Lewinellaceae bacterium]|nr:NAD(P)/FAD-dependent oxidoreductase [Lewinellaceae bacterium]
MRIAIIGNGISGITAARTIRKRSNADIVVISAETDYFFSRTALMYVYMGHLRFEDTQPYEPWFWEKNRIELLRNWVDRVDFANKSIQFATGKMAYDKLILATGSKSNRFGWPGQDLRRVSGLYSYQDLEKMESYSHDLRHAVIVGGGLIGIEMAEMFRSRGIGVTFLVREAGYWDMVLPPEESAMVGRHIREHGIDLRLNAELREIVDDGQGRACAVITNSGERIDCQYVGLTAGVSPNVDFLREAGLEIGKGILVNEFLETNIPDVYAVGDCAQLREPRPGRKPIEAVWYTGRMMGEAVAWTITGRRTAYDPGIWFNSAKFLDIEYQVYGEVPVKLADGQAALYWEHPDGKRSIRLVYEQAGGAVIGFNLMGVRFRHEVCDRWIRTKTPVEEVLQNLGAANFDPEFYGQFESELVKDYNSRTGKRVELKKRRGMRN